MKNYKAMKSAKSWSVKKAKVVDSKAVSEVKDEDGKIVREAQAEATRDELQLVRKQVVTLTMKGFWKYSSTIKPRRAAESRPMTLAKARRRKRRQDQGAPTTAASGGRPPTAEPP